MLRLRQVVLTVSVVIAFVAATLAMRSWSPQQSATAGIAPRVQISKEQFNRYINDWSEPEGFFDSDNFISNETSYLHVIDQLKKRVLPGGVYLGVGPDQNFSYIAHTRPSLAIIIDIRRQNMLEHLLYKSLFDLSSSRAEFLGLLFSRKTPDVARNVQLPALLAAIRSAPTSTELHQRNLALITDLLINKYSLDLTAEDLSKIAYVYDTFWREGLDLRFSSIGRGNALQYPTYENLMVATDLLGKPQNYLATDELFQWMKTFEHENRLIPIVGDFSGTHAFSAAAKFLSAQGLRVNTFYTSNVEYYLFDRPAWKAYMENVGQLPVSPGAVFIRAYFSNYGQRHPLNVSGHRSTTLVHDLPQFLADYVDGKIRTYWDVVDR